MTETAAQSNPPAFSAIYSGSVIPGVDIAQLLSTLLFSTNQPSATAVGTFQISASTSNANVNLVVTPGILSVLPVTPLLDPSLVSAQTNPPPLPVLHNIPASLFGYTAPESYSPGFAALITAENNNVNAISSASFLDTTPSAVHEDTGNREPQRP